MPRDTGDFDRQTAAAAKRAEVLKDAPKAWIIPETFPSVIELGQDADTNVTALSIPERSGILSKQELALTENYTARELLAKLASESVSCKDVTTAFCKRAAFAQHLTNCLTKTFYGRALESAQFLDDHFETHARLLGPLHGLPVSLKDCFDHVGIPGTCGLISWLSDPLASSNPTTVAMLLDLGAVLYVKTNVPQSLMTCDSQNNIFGRALNPLKLSLTAGGSSGGETALIAFRGSILGIGTDYGGSVRMPALCTGIYGFKPTSGRIPLSDGTGAAPRRYVPFRACAGSMATTLDDLELFIQVITSASPDQYDADVDPVPWRSFVGRASERLTIGVLMEDPIYPLHPPIRRALLSAAARLGAAFHCVINVPQEPLNNVTMAKDAMLKYYATDPEALILKSIQDGKETFIESLSRGGKSILAPCPSMLELGSMKKDRLTMIDRLRKVWVDNKLGILLTPPAQNTAVKHDHFNFIPYTAIWNLMDFPAVLIPYISSSKLLDPEPVTIAPPATGLDYDPVMNDGAPCAVQVVARRFKDEECLRAARIVGRVLNKS